MATVTQAQLTCDVCGDTNDVKTRTFGLDGQAYEIDLCRKDGNALGRVAARKPGRSQPNGVVGSRVAGRGPGWPPQPALTGPGREPPGPRRRRRPSPAT